MKTGRTASAPLENLTYDGTVASALIYFVVPGTIVPLKNEPHEGIHFNLRDQIALSGFLAAKILNVFAQYRRDEQ